jgi:hypothetical protein
MDSHQPMAILPEEWAEIAEMADIRSAWGLSDDEAGKELASVCYGAKFQFITGSPGWAGTLFVIHDDAFGGPPMVFRRAPHGPIEAVSYSDQR